MSEIYINSIKQISAQKPLTDEWFDAPVRYSENYVRAIDPDFRQYFAPNVARRFGKILKRALVVSQKALEESDVTNPDAIITGTGLGCIENTELFLDKLVREGEELLNPTQFMQSTHNTISSLIAIEAKCHSYNTTYAHKGISFECALQDALLQLQSGGIKTALVGAHDEMTPAYFTLLQKAGFLGQANQTFAGETAVAMMLTNQKTEKSLCKIENVEKFYGNVETWRAASLQVSDIDYIMLGTNGVAETDRIYYENCQKLFPDIPLLQYKNIFGESYTAPAFGVYAAALCLKNGKIPDFLEQRAKLVPPKRESEEQRQNAVRKILCYNQLENKNHTFVCLTSKNLTPKK
ncbi:MAG: beta-ketoacyl synthase chain length factor [Prevotellaceae bacterium]|jgi:3-oxoacyl-(acyl-carrier-protein) synthase|nr:beta-ketoacyl synthase chain length factor [Prevotellaceae bacterium]